MFNNVKQSVSALTFVSCMQIIIYLMQRYAAVAYEVILSSGWGLKFEQGTVKTKRIWGILPQEKFRKGEGNATLSGSN
jgi:hypothetical protein